MSFKCDVKVVQKMYMPYENVHILSNNIGARPSLRLFQPWVWYLLMRNRLVYFLHKCILNKTWTTLTTTYSIFCEEYMSTLQSFSSQSKILGDLSVKTASWVIFQPSSFRTHASVHTLIHLNEEIDINMIKYITLTCELNYSLASDIVWIGCYWYI